MTQRERFLSLLIGGLLLGSGIWWALGKYQSAIKTRNGQIASLENRQAELNEQRLQGEYANRQMGEYIVRSLPGDAETAQSRYQKWLLSAMQEHQMTDQSVDPTSSRLIGDLYRQFSFRVQGNTTSENVIDLLHAFYSKDYLHRIRSLSMRPSRTGGFRVEMTVDAIALQNAPADLAEPMRQSWQVTESAQQYRKAILDRNLYEPPNQAPKFAGKDQLDAIVEKKTTIPLVFKDQEDHEMTFELVDKPTFKDESGSLTIDEKTGTIVVESSEKKPIEITVRATDKGYPNRSTQQKLTINIVDPPPPPKPEPLKLKFDDAKQTVLTGLVQGRGEWTAWLNVRTRDKTLKLRVGDSFEIGSVKGKVVEVSAKSAVLEADGQKFELKLFGNLSEGAKTASEVD
ncbi:hypothetical protein LF1_19520 [Rubripirellula obstinata]|uniref:Cadherin domain-containing protein n=1 Tax=Rubripirellula obstinata TaxID=406547 RepID=A0A5B1CII8_9BACT|nr:cadherin repeat domain-containing protein [Rubripirellula obstinata]KAA1259420.1 hypothetical protein LF1_19520 [Rubripirellula obstinata]